ncbi:hypothetical protein [Kocuria sabuli]
MSSTAWRSSTAGISCSSTMSIGSAGPAIAKASGDSVRLTCPEIVTCCPT